MKQTPCYDGTRIKALLAERGQKARWLAGRAGVSESHLSRVIAGERLASPTTAERVAAALQLPLFLVFQLHDRSDSLPVGNAEGVAA